MFKLVSETREWFLGNLVGKSCSSPLLLECVCVCLKGNVRDEPL